MSNSKAQEEKITTESEINDHEEDADNNASRCHGHAMLFELKRFFLFLSWNSFYHISSPSNGDACIIQIVVSLATRIMKAYIFHLVCCSRFVMESKDAFECCKNSIVLALLTFNGAVNKLLGVR